MLQLVPIPSAHGFLPARLMPKGIIILTVILTQGSLRPPRLKPRRRREMDRQSDSRYENGWKTGLQGGNRLDESSGQFCLPAGTYSTLIGFLIVYEGLGLADWVSKRSLSVPRAVSSVLRF